ncbi:hypothetical protein O1Q96_05620 [Streptomyces sp. Qhu-G9]|uniref:hypothetical protein n=1 Tax=Streptomyces sp. Qhu-G9 TaxID=3452799 RepID=UPI0022AC1568|nr:hypothetical protein [Streptomyces aurantiacus]WAU79281.1 hypothetical protein O1Q96_05620 [Streptomyces aurantiacus]
MRTTRIGLALLCASVALSGCSSSDPDERVRSEEAPPVDFSDPPNVSATPTMGSSRSLELPLEAYSWTDEEERTRRRGEDLIAAECMRGFGFDLEPRPVYRGDKALRDANRYGVTDPDKASRFGYRIDPASRGPKPPEEDYSPAESLALFGPQDGKSGRKTADGKSVPKGGCWGKALRELAANGPKVHPDKEEFANHLAVFTFQEAQKDSRVKRVFAQWSDCMKKKGYDYKMPMAPVEDRSLQASETASAREIQVAEADVACKREHNVIGVWYGVEVAYQERAIEKNQQQLDTLKKRKEAILRAAAAAGTR